MSIINKLNQLYETKTFTPPSNVIYVSEIVSYHLNTTLPPPDVLRAGSWLHAGVQAIISKSIPEARIEVPISSQFEDFIIRGRIDLMSQNEIFEIKSSENAKEFARVQLSIYRWMMKGYYDLYLLTPRRILKLYPLTNVEVEKIVSEYVKVRKAFFSQVNQCKSSVSDNEEVQKGVRSKETYEEKV